MFRDVPYIVAGENGVVTRTNPATPIKNYTRTIDRWKFKEVYYGAIPYCVGKQTAGSGNGSGVTMVVGIEDSDDNSTWTELNQQGIADPPHYPHTTDYPATTAAGTYYFQTNATPWDLRRAKRYIRAYVTPTLKAANGTDSFDYHVGLAFVSADDAPPTNLPAN